MASKAIKMGDQVRDEVSGVEGIVVGVCDLISGLRTMGVQPRALDGKVPPVEWIDVRHLEVTRLQVVVPQPALAWPHEEA